MSDYRPITDVMILARAKLRGGVKYYGSFPAGFLHRARTLMRCRLSDPVLFVCGGRVRSRASYLVAQHHDTGSL